MVWFAIYDSELCDLTCIKQVSTSCCRDSVTDEMYSTFQLGSERKLMDYITHRNPNRCLSFEQRRKRKSPEYADRLHRAFKYVAYLLRKPRKLVKRNIEKHGVRRISLPFPIENEVLYIYKCITGIGWKFINNHVNYLTKYDAEHLRGILTSPYDCFDSETMYCKMSFTCKYSNRVIKFILRCLSPRTPEFSVENLVWRLNYAGIRYVVNKYAEVIKIVKCYFDVC